MPYFMSVGVLMLGVMAEYACMQHARCGYGNSFSWAS